MDFMTPEEKDIYSNSTIYIRTTEDPTTINRSFFAEPIVHYVLRFDPVTERSWILERHSISDDYKGNPYYPG